MDDLLGQDRDTVVADWAALLRAWTEELERLADLAAAHTFGAMTAAWHLDHLAELLLPCPVTVEPPWVPDPGDPTGRLVGGQWPVPIGSDPPGHLDGPDDSYRPPWPATLLGSDSGCF